MNHGLKNHWSRSLALACLLAVPASGETAESVVTRGPVTFSVALGAAQGQVAEPIDIQLQVDAPRDVTLQLPDLNGSIGPFEVLHFQWAPPIPVGDENHFRRWTGVGQIETLQTGELSIPSLEVHVRTTADDSSETLRSQPVRVRIASLLEGRVDPAALRDLKDVVDVAVPPTGPWRWRSWLGGAVATLALAGAAAAYFALRHRQISAAQWAKTEIDRVEHQFVASQTDAVVTYERLTDILAEYLRMRGMTSTMDGNENLPDAGHLPLTPDMRRQIHQLQQIAEQVKFACRTVGPSDVRQAIDDVRKLVEACEHVISPRRTESA